MTPEGDRTRLLLVDDDPDLSWALGRRLTRAGMAVTVCGDGSEALPLLREESFDVLITDIQMPNMNGLALIEWSAQHHPQLSIVAITAFGSPSVQKVAQRKGAILYLEKPVDPEMLIDVIYGFEQQDSFAGCVDCIDLFDYVQLMIMSGQSSVLDLSTRSGDTGRLYVHRGQIQHACCGDLEGLEAFYRCLSFEGGRFTSLPWREPPRMSIELASDFLLMEAARRKDEAASPALSSTSNDSAAQVVEDLGWDSWGEEDDSTDP